MLFYKMTYRGRFNMQSLYLPLNALPLNDAKSHIVFTCFSNRTQGNCFHVLKGSPFTQSASHPPWPRGDVSPRTEHSWVLRGESIVSEVSVPVGPAARPTAVLSSTSSLSQPALPDSAPGMRRDGGHRDAEYLLSTACQS